MDFDFAIVLVALVAFTGFFYLLDLLFLKRKRSAETPAPQWVEFPASFSRCWWWYWCYAPFWWNPLKYPPGP